MTDFFVDAVPIDTGRHSQTPGMPSLHMTDTAPTRGDDKDMSRTGRNGIYFEAASPK